MKYTDLIRYESKYLPRYWIPQLEKTVENRLQHLKRQKLGHFPMIGGSFTK